MNYERIVFMRLKDINITGGVRAYVLVFGYLYTFEHALHLYPSLLVFRLIVEDDILYFEA